MKETFCPECDLILKIKGRLHEGQRTVCSRCKAKLVVTGVDPLQVEFMDLKDAVRSKKKANMAICPECDQPVKLSSRARKGERVVCNACQARLTVVNVSPLELELAALVNNRRSR